MAPIVFTLLALMALVLARAAGLSWQGILHWMGELLLVLGILLAAKGISDVRRQWTGLPGIAARAQQAARATQGRAVSLMWACWNKVARAAWLAQRLHLRPHITQASTSGGLLLRGMTIGNPSVTTEVNRASAPANGTVEQRLAWLEERMATALAAIDSQHVRHEHEAQERQADAAQEREARIAEDQITRGSIANLAGGGLRLQTWGVVCLLAGTIMTALW